MDSMASPIPRQTSRWLLSLKMDRIKNELILRRPENSKRLRKSRKLDTKSLRPKFNDIKCARRPVQRPFIYMKIFIFSFLRFIFSRFRSAAGEGRKETTKTASVADANIRLEQRGKSDAKKIKILTRTHERLVELSCWGRLIDHWFLIHAMPP